MPNVLVRPEQLCTSLRKDGSPCRSPRRIGQPFCTSHSPERTRPKMPEETVKPVESLDALMHLDPADPVLLQRIRVGLMQHVMAETINYQVASVAMRFAEAAHAHAPKRKGNDHLSATSRALLGGRGEIAQSESNRDRPRSQCAEAGGSAGTEQVVVEGGEAAS